MNNTFKDLKLSDLENVSGGNAWRTAGKHIFSAGITAGVSALATPFVGVLAGAAAEVSFDEAVPTF